MLWHLCRSQRDCLFTDWMREPAAGLATQDREGPGKPDGHTWNTNHRKWSGHVDSKDTITFVSFIPAFLSSPENCREQGKDIVQAPWLFVQSGSWLQPKGMTSRPTANSYTCALPVHPTRDKMRGRSLWPQIHKVKGWQWKSLSHVRLFATPWTIESMEFSRPEYWGG